MMSTCDSVDVGAGAGRELLLQQLEVNRHRVERVLHFVRDAGRQAARAP